ncbi:MAG: hypothetical protein KDD77_02665 [Caldilineaceae bacterium]|nr:hypothetical protein [Caldilineaceae bacterium]
MTSPADRLDLQNIELYWFFQVLQDQYGIPDEAFRQLDALRGFGVEVSAQTDDGRYLPVKHPDLTAALTQVRDIYNDEEDTTGPEKAWFSVPVTISDEEPREEVIGRLFVNESNVAEANARSGVNTYWWPKVKWPRGRVDLEKRERVTLTHVTEVADGNPPIQERTETDSGKKPTALALHRRRDCLRRWLKTTKIPEEQWPNLPGISLKEIYDQLKNFDEFLTPDGLHIKFSTFQREFWRKQQICKLPNKAKQ